MLALLPLLAVTAHATTYDLAKDFHAAANPASGTMVYGSVDVATLTFQRFNVKTTTADGLKVWSKDATLKPGVKKSPQTITVDNVTYPKTGYVALRPTDARYTVVRFQAPADGGYTMTAMFKSLRASGAASAQGYILSDAGGRATYGWLQYVNVMGTYVNGDAQASVIYQGLSLKQGDIVDFMVTTDPNTNSNTDDIGLKLIIQDDDDFDWVEDSVDNCPKTDNPLQEDANNDGTGDACGGAKLNASDIDVIWDTGATNGKVEVTITTTKANGFLIGMAETADFDTGWFEEDGFGAYVHNVPTVLSRNLTYVEAEADIVAGRKTLFDGDQAFDLNLDDRLTYFIMMNGLQLDNKCYVWGDFPSYYQGVGCTFL